MNTTKYDGNKIVSWDRCDWRPILLPPMKMSEAIRIGAKLRPQCTGTFIGKTWHWYHFVTGSCALGAAGEVAFGHQDAGSMWFSKVPKHFGVPDDIAGRVWRLNDKGWSREKIADWLQERGY